MTTKPKTNADQIRSRIKEIRAAYTGHGEARFTAAQFKDIKDASNVLSRMAKSHRGEEYSELAVERKPGEPNAYSFLRDPIPQKRRTGGKPKCKHRARPKAIDEMNKVCPVYSAWREALPEWFLLPVGNGNATVHKQSF